VPTFDVLMLGTGPEGHVASLFPDSTGVAETRRTVVPVTDSPKPPAERLSFTLPALQAAREVWVVTAGAEKADAVAGALAGTPAAQLPASGARGRLATLWLVDRSAARR
jgi:6-phosphogluconolactonase